jgi:hypothetical protein
MIIEQKDMRRVQTILLAILSALWIIFCVGVWRSSPRSGFDALFIAVSTAVVLAIVLFLLARKWEGEVVSQSEKIEYLDNPNSVSDRVEVHFARIRLPSGRFKRVRLGSNKEVLDRLDVKEGDRLVKRRWALFCVVERGS